MTATTRDPVAAAPHRHPLIRRWDDLPLRTKGMAVIAISVLPLLVSDNRPGENEGDHV